MPMQPVACAALLLAALPLLRLCAAYARARRRRRLPCDAALLLGGCVARGRAAPDSPLPRLTRLRSDETRERLAAALLAGTAPPATCVAGPPGACRDAALSACAGCTSLRVVVSSAALRGAAPFVAAGVARHRLLVDDTATDTVSNFAAAAPLLRALRARHVLVLTSASHARRAAAVAAVALGGCGVAATVVPLRDGGGDGGESRLRLARDVARAAAWALCGVHGGALGRLAHPERFYHLDARRRRRDTTDDT